MQDSQLFTLEDQYYTAIWAVPSGLGREKRLCAWKMQQHREIRLDAVFSRLQAPMAQEKDTFDI